MAEHLGKIITIERTYHRFLFIIELKNVWSITHLRTKKSYNLISSAEAILQDPFILIN